MVWCCVIGSNEGQQIGLRARGVVLSYRKQSRPMNGGYMHMVLCYRKQKYQCMGATCTWRCVVGSKKINVWELRAHDAVLQWRAQGGVGRATKP